jgi:simple sugar transport system permease protein
VTYACDTACHAFENVSPGAEKKYFDALRVGVSVMTMRMPPTMIDATNARTVTTMGCVERSQIAVRRARDGGALWGGLSGWLKARTGAHEVITTIMLNYVAVFLLGYLLTENGFKRSGSNQAISRIVDSNARLPKLFPEPLRVHAGLIVALLAAAGVAWLLNRSKLGFQLRAVGTNQFAARTAGMDVGRNYVVSMMLSGALAGLAGCSQILGTNSSITQDIDAGIGFTAITVALLGRAQPWPTVLAGILYGAFQAGGVTMQSRTGTPIDLVNVLQSIIVLFIAAPALVSAIFRLRGAADTSGQQLAKGWNG